MNTDPPKPQWHYYKQRKKADAWMYWINIFIQFFQQNNEIVNLQVQKKNGINSSNRITIYHYITHAPRHIPIHHSLPPRTFHTPAWNHPSYNIHPHPLNNYVTILNTACPHTIFSVLQNYTYDYIIFLFLLQSEILHSTTETRLVSPVLTLFRILTILSIYKPTLYYNGVVSKILTIIPSGFTYTD
jgi:hypothetical protein